MHGILSLGIAAFCLLAVGQPAQAGCRWVWHGIESKWECDSNRNYSKFFVKNDCNQKIRVGVRYYVAENGSGTWRDAGWYTFVPGENAYLVPSTSRNICVYAESTNGSLKWSGNQCAVRLDGRDLAGKQIDMGPSFVDYTYSFSCRN